MELHSAQKRAHPAITRMACAILLSIALLQSFQMAYSKSHRWDELLQQEFVVDEGLILVVPSGWRQAASTADDEVILRGELSGMAGEYELRVLRPAQVGVGSLGQALERILVQGGATMSIAELRPVECLLDRQPVVNRGFEWSSAEGLPVNLRVIVAEDAAGGVTALGLRVVGGSDDVVRGLLRRIAARANFSVMG